MPPRRTLTLTDPDCRFTPLRLTDRTDRCCDFPSWGKRGGASPGPVQAEVP
jgi:hypothetical protein